MKTKILLITIACFISGALYSQIIHVPADYNTIQEGINAASDGDTVLVDTGTYVENINFSGKDIIVASLFLTTQDTMYIYETVIDGNQNGSSVVRFENEESQAAELCGFTITHGNSSTSGGGIACVYSSPKLNHLIISENSAAYNGGGIICGAFASPSLDHVIFTSNTAGGDGGAIYCYNNCNPTLENVIINSNSTPNHGGGICCLESCYLSLNGVSIENNSASEGGGILCAFNSNLDLEDVIINNNSATEGGGIYMIENSLSLSQTVITNNTASLGAGIFCDARSELFLNQTSISNNTATSKGAGIYSFNARLNIDECEFFENEIIAGVGGAINFNCGGEIEQLPWIDINNTIISSNLGIGPGSSSGIAIYKPDEFPPFTVQIENCTFEENVSNSNTALRITGSGLDFNIIDCSFLSNEARMHNAGVALTNGCTGEITNCLFASNIGNTDGGESNTGGLTLWNGVEANLLNCTFVENSAFMGTAMTMNASEALLLNCIVWDNTNDQITLLAGDVGSNLTIAYSDIQNGESGIVIGESSEVVWAEGNIDEDPVFLDYGDHPFSLDLGSPCIDTGIPDTTGMELPPEDCLGNIRVWDGNGDNVYIIDMGPYEYGSIPVSIEEPTSNIANEIKSQAFPNPFTTSTTIEYELTKPSSVQLTIYDYLGKQIEVIEQKQAQGKQQIIWNAEGLPAGVYYFRLMVGGQLASGKLVLVK